MEVYIRDLIESYKDLTPDNPSSWVLLSDDPKWVDESYAKVCHADLRNNLYTEWTKLLLPVTGDHAVEYCTHLINGPFSKYKEWIKIEKFEQNHYILLTGLDEFPANALFNFCIATRAPIEFPNTIRSWLNLRSFGMPANLALVIAGLTEPSDVITGLDEKANFVGTPNANHWWFDNGSRWDQLLNGIPHALAAPYNSKSKRCTPTNVIWGESIIIHTMNMFETKTLREIMEKYA